MPYRPDLHFNHYPYTMNFMVYTQISKQWPRLLYQLSAVLALFFLLTGLVLSVANAATTKLSFTEGTIALPATDIHSETGNAHRLSDFKGGAVIVNFWASWCAPCIVELPELEKLAVSLKADNIQVILVNLDRAGPQAGLPLLSAKNITTPLSLFDPKASWAKTLKISGLPVTLFIPPSQSGYSYHIGPVMWTDTDVKSQLLEKLASD